MKKCNVEYAEKKGGNSELTKNRQNQDMYDLYESYKVTLHNARKALASRQKINADMRDKYGSPFHREDYNLNKSDITNWNSMINELEVNMKEMELYLDFDDRVLLHRDYDNMKSMILNKNSYEGQIPLDDLYGECVKDTTDIICDVELQEEIVELLDDVLTGRQIQVVQMYFWEGMTQEKIAKELGVTQQAVTKIITNSIEILRNYVKSSDFLDF